MSTIPERIEMLRNAMKENHIDIYYIPTNDYHSSEYIDDHFKCREYLSGFTGSAGTMIVTMEEAGLWTDGRYFLQAEKQLEGSGITLYKINEPGVPTETEYMKNILKEGICVGFDGRVVAAKFVEELCEYAEEIGAFVVGGYDLMDMIWEDRPAIHVGPAYSLDIRYTGMERKEKLEKVSHWLKEQKVDTLVVSALDEIAWLLNIRGEDIHCNPVVMGFLVIRPLERFLYVHTESFSQRLRQELARDSVILREYTGIYGYLAGLGAGSRVAMDLSRINHALEQAVPLDAEIVDVISPIQMMKAVKNPVEIAGAKVAHIKDGVALVRFMYWLKENINKMPLTERLASAQLEAFRGSVGDYMGASFDPISAYGPHSAVVHYSATAETDVPLDSEGFLLLDTGGHYIQGTTDVTRVIHLGGEVTQEQKDYYTAVLKGNLHLAAATFKKGCSGVALDILARQPLWEMGCDYNHSTGHGVGSHLNVHEGPNGINYKISKQRGRNVEFEPGMITSDEPGIYLAGKYGIRLENLLLCVEKTQNEFGEFLGFETLTLAPFERDAIDPEQLSEQDKKLLNEYHERVYETLLPYLNRGEAEWLLDACAAI